MARIRHLFTTGSVLLTLLVLAGPGGARGAAPVENAAPMAAPGSPTIVTHPPGQVRPTAGVCVARVGDRSRIYALPAKLPILPAAPAATDILRHDERAGLTADDPLLADRSEFVATVPTFVRPARTVPLCRSPPPL